MPTHPRAATPDRAMGREHRRAHAGSGGTGPGSRSLAVEALTRQSRVFLMPVSVFLATGRPKHVL